MPPRHVGTLKKKLARSRRKGCRMMVLKSPIALALGELGEKS